MSLGDGTFASDVQVTAVSPMGVTCADLDGDGDMDLASTQSSDTVRIHFNSCRLGNGY